MTDSKYANFDYELCTKILSLLKVVYVCFYLRWYLTLQGDNSVKSAKRFNYSCVVKGILSFSMIKIGNFQTAI